MSPVHSADTLWVKNFIKIALSRTVFKINAFYAEIQDGRQKWGKVIFAKVVSPPCRYPADPKFCRNCSISHCFRDKCAFAIYAEIQDGCQKWRESDFCEKSPADSVDTLRVKNFVEITLSRMVKEIEANLCFSIFGEKFDNSKWPPSLGGENFF